VKNLIPKTGTSINEWRSKVLIPYVVERENFVCWKPECYNRASDVHEALYSRNDVRGWDWNRKVLIHTPYNCIALCRDCHKNSIPDKEDVLDWMLDEYGIVVLDWCEGLPFVINPLATLLERKRL